MQPSAFSALPSAGISVINSGYSGLKSGLVSGNSFDFGSTVAPAISYSSSSDFISNGFAGGLYGGAPFGGVSAVTAAPALSEASVVTAAPSVIGASLSTSAPLLSGVSSGSFGSGVVSGGLLEGASAGVALPAAGGAELLGSYGYGAGLGYSGLGAGSLGIGQAQNLFRSGE